MSSGLSGGVPQQAITRESLADGSFMRVARAIPGLLVHSDEELETMLTNLLREADDRQSVWVFAYGSLMWNPAFRFAEARAARLKDWQRRFCLRLTFGRASPEAPGLALALAAGGQVDGVAFHLTGTLVDSELILVWRREMFSGAYAARWVTLETREGPIRAITFVADTAKASYVGDLDDVTTARLLRGSHGPLGSGVTYLEETSRHLGTLGITDPALDRIAVLVDDPTVGAE